MVADRPHSKERLGRSSFDTTSQGFKELLSHSESRGGCCRCSIHLCRECPPYTACNTGPCKGRIPRAAHASSLQVQPGRRECPALVGYGLLHPAPQVSRRYPGDTSR